MLKQSIYFHTTLSYSAYTIATLAYHLPCFLPSPDPSVQKCVCDAAHAWHIHIILCYFTYSIHCLVNWCGPIAFPFYTHSASPRLPVLHALPNETHETSALVIPILQIGLGHPYTEHNAEKVTWNHFRAFNSQWSYFVNALCNFGQ